MTTQGTDVRYPDISDHGLIGDLQTSALVTSDGTIDFSAAPVRFAEHLRVAAGSRERRYFGIAPAGDNYVTKQLYMPGTRC